MCQKLFSRYKFRLILIGALVLLWWWVKYIQKEEEKGIQSASIKLSEALKPSSDIPKVLETSSRSPAIPFEKEKQKKTSSVDDLRLIEGIGPKIASVLVEAGIVSFNKLSGMKPEEIKAILNNANIPLAQPDTWPEQARMAANGEWQALEAFQGQLKGGRRV